MVQRFTIPFADAQPNGASAARAALIGRGSDAVLESITLGNILLDIYINVMESLKTREDPRGTTLFASEAMDQILEPLRGSPLKSKKLDSKSCAWLSLVPLATSSAFCGDLGLAMQPRSQDPANV